VPLNRVTFSAFSLSEKAEKISLGTQRLAVSKKDPLRVIIQVIPFRGGR
jgi:hypothetical protein